MIVVDASVIVKWYVLEAGSDTAIELQNGHDMLVAPDLLAVEVTGALVRRANMDLAQRSAIQLLLADVSQSLARQVPVLRRTTGNDLDQAAALALELAHPLKDCIYLSVARGLKCPLVTADAKFAAKARSIYTSVRLLKD